MRKGSCKLAGNLASVMATAACVIASGCAREAPPAAAAAPAARAAESGWSSVAGKPDLWTGLWEPRYWEKPQPGAPPAEPAPLTPEYAARLQSDLKAAAANTGGASPSANCLPPGMPRIMKMNYPYQFALAHDEILILVETYMQVRHIHMDGSPHYADGDRAFFNGYSSGRWEGDTLLIETVGIDASTPLGSQGNSLISVPIRHSEQLKVSERIRLVDRDTMEITTTAEDPLALTRPWKTTTRLYRIEGDLDEYICQQNNRAFIDEHGRQGVRLDE